jgi:hypothetical protein
MQPKESQAAIRRNPQNEIASFRALTLQKLAISNAAATTKSTPAQWLGRLFTVDYPQRLAPPLIHGESGPE